MPCGSPEKLGRAVREVSNIYNRLVHKPAAGRRDLALARLHFFMPTDLPKVWLPLGELLPHMELDKRKELWLLDLGGGAGTVTAGLVLLLELMGFAGTLNVTQVEPDGVVGGLTASTEAALRQVTSVSFKLNLMRATVEQFMGKNSSQRYDLVVMLDVLTEMFDESNYSEKTARLARALLSRQVRSTGFLVLIEPALKQVSRLLSQARDALAGDRPLTAPCPALPGCPSVEKPEGFCFHSISCPLSPLTQSVAARAELARHEVNFSYLTLSPSGSALPAPALEPGLVPARVVSFPRRAKKGYNYHVCGRHGLQVAFAPRILPDGETRGGRLKSGTLVALAIPGQPDYNQGDS